MIIRQKRKKYRTKGLCLLIRHPSIKIIEFDYSPVSTFVECAGVPDKSFVSEVDGISGVVSSGSVRPVIPRIETGLSA